MSNILNNKTSKVNTPVLANKYKDTNTYTVQALGINPKDIIPPTADVLHINLTNNLYPQSCDDGITLYPGYKCYDSSLNQKGDTIIFRLREIVTNHTCCPHCGSHLVIKHGYNQCSLVDSKIGTKKVELKCTSQRYKCNHCYKTFSNRISFKHPCHDITLRMFDVIREEMESCKVSAFYVEQKYGVSRKIVSQIDKANSIYNMQDIPTDNLKYLAIDEHSIFANHHYITFILNAETSQVVYCCYGKSKADLQPFFDLLKQRGHHTNILGVSCDCNAGFINMFKENCPNVNIVIDEFHVLKTYNEAMQIVRIQLKQDVKKKVQKHMQQIHLMEKEINSLSKTLKDNEITQLKAMLEAKIKEYQELKEEAFYFEKSRWFLCKGLSKVELEKSGSSFLEFLKANETLKDFLQIGDEIRALWHSPYSPAKVKQYALILAKRCTACIYEPIKAFGNFILRHVDHIKYASSTGLSNSRTEGVCSAFKAFQRIIRGVKDVEYYIAKLHAMFRYPRSSKLKSLYVRQNGFVFK